jgi:serine/threonine protein kinase
VTSAASAEQLRRLHRLFDEAMELTAEPRTAWLARLAVDEPELAASLQRLIAAEEAEAGLDARRLQQQIDQTLRQMLPESLAPGTPVGAYRVIEEIGAGGMGRVFRAERDDPSLRHDVAIKVVRRDMLTPQALARFQSERAVLARLQHPGICQFIDAGTLDDGSPYVVMEWLRDAVPIGAFADRERLDIDQRIDLFRLVLDAVQYAHRNLVVHRDIKAGNILVLPDGQPKLLDFGIAKSIADDSARQATATSERFFSLATAAPEQLSGAPITVACDIYSLGALLYELLAGRAPLADAGDSLPMLIEQIAHRIPPPMRQAAMRLDAAGLEARRTSTGALARGLSGDIEDIVQRCLRKDPGERYRSVDALDADLQRLREGLPISLRGSQAGYRLRKFVARHRIASALTAALLLSLIASAWIVALQNVRIRAERDQAEEALSLMRDAFLSADPARFSGETVTARQVMDSAYATMQHRSAENALAFPDLLVTMAEVELSLDGSERALQLTRQARASANEIELGVALRDRLDLAQASALSSNGKIEEAQQLLAAFTPANDAQRIEWLLLKGRNLTAGGDAESAEHLLREAVTLTSNLPPSDRSANRARRHLAENLARQDRPTEAVALLESIHAWQRTGLDEDHPYVLLVELLLANELRKIDREDEALAIARRSASLAEQTYGTLSTMAARAHMTLGNVLIARNDYVSAEASLRRSRDALERILGRLHPNTVRAQFNLAVALDEQHPKPASAAAELRRALGDIRGSEGPKSMFTALCSLRLAAHLIESGAKDEAAALLGDPELAAVLETAPDTLKAMATDIRASLPIAGRDSHPTTPVR